MSTQQCPQCGKLVSVEDSFCRACGAKLPQPQQNAEAQPKQFQQLQQSVQKVAADQFSFRRVPCRVLGQV
jgi:hypothetical protein